MLDTSMSDAEYEVESVTKARVDGKRGKKLIWKYCVKWKGYEWDECTWEPEKSFAGGSKHFIKTFWTNALTGGRDHTNSLLFEKGEEVWASATGANQHREINSSSPNQRELPERSEDAVSDDELLTTKKRRIHRKPAEEPKAKRKRKSEPAIATGSASAQRTRAFGPKSKAKSPKSKKQRRASSPGVEAKRRFSLTNMTDTDAVGEVDMDVSGEAREVEDDLMLMSPDGPESRDIPESSAGLVKVDGTTVVFQDLQRYSSDFQDIIEVVTDDNTPPVGEGRSSPDPLFDSPSQFGNGERSLSFAEPAMPFHRVREPLVKSIDAPLVVKNPEVAISTKARLISRQPSGSSQDVSSSNGVPEIRPRPGPGRSSSGFLGKNRSSLLTAGKRGLTSVKGRFKPTKNAREEIESIEDAPAPSQVAGRSFTITSWSDEDGAGETDHEHQETAPLAEQMDAAPTHLSVPSGHELLEVAGLKPNVNTLPDFEDQETAPLAEQMEAAPSHLSIPSGHELLEMAGLMPIADVLPEFEDVAPQPANGSLVDSIADVPTEDAPPAMMTVKEKAAEKSLAEATENLFPSVQSTSSVQSITTSSWKTSKKDNTIFGRFYKLPQPVQGPSNGNESVPTFKLNLNTDVTVPLMLKDLKDMKGVSFTDISADKSLGGQAGSFYLSEDALTIACTFSGVGSARVVLGPSADENQKKHFGVFQRRLQSGQMFVAKAGKELLAFFSSQNLEITQKLAPPQVLIGLANTVLLMRVQITDRSGYANAVMQSSPM